jgi:RNA-directed DNA polymerase
VAKAVMTKLRLTLNEANTSVRDARNERFDFLGYTLGPARRREKRPLVSGRKPIEEECSAGQDQDRRSPEARRQGAIPRGARSTEPASDRLVGVSRLGSGLPAYRAVDRHVHDRRPALPRSTVQGARARPAVLRKSSGTSACSVYNACKFDRRPEPCDEISRKAGCLDRARPV